MDVECSEVEEREYRKEVLLSAFNRLRERKTTEERDRVLQLMHEIESYLFLHSLGTAKMAIDSKHESGSDFIFDKDISIECVCATMGDAESSGLNKYLGEGFYDYNEKKRLINARLTNSLCEKTKFYYNHNKPNKQINDPYVIFLSLGILTYEWFGEEYGKALTDVLLGRGNQQFIVNTKTGEVIESGYEHTISFKKWNGAEITSNLFLCPDFQCVSAILLATMSTDKYSSQNTFLFVNPFAKTPIDPKRFGDIVYWKENSSNEYRPYRDGRLVAI